MTPQCRCRGCGDPDPMACGGLCADCSFASHLPGNPLGEDIAERPHQDTPTCCLASAAEPVR